MATGPKLTPDEDAELRRLHWFEGLGCQLSDALATLKSNIRARDRRSFIREPSSNIGVVNQDAPSTPPAAPQQQRKVDEAGYWVRVRK
jgi:hypothetical protein